MRHHVAVLLALLTAACAPVENKQNHIFHAGDQARLVITGQASGYAAVAKPDSDVLAHALNTRNADDLASLVSSGRAIQVESGTPVRIIAESFNERQVEIADGPHKGKKGWLPFEWLKP